MLLLGAHYLPFAFLYGMRMFAVSETLLVGSGLVIATYWSRSFSEGAWYTDSTLLLFAGLGRAIAQYECREKLPDMSLQRTEGPLRAFSSYLDRDVSFRDIMHMRMVRTEDGADSIYGANSNSSRNGLMRV